MPAGNWLLPEHHHRVQPLPLVAMFHAQHFKPSLAHDVGELLRLVQPESLPVARERPQGLSWRVRPPTRVKPGRYAGGQLASARAPPPCPTPATGRDVPRAALQTQPRA